MTLETIENSTKFRLDGLMKPKIFEVHLSPTRQVELRNIHTDYRRYDLGNIESIQVDGNAYDDDVSHLDRIQNIVY